MFLLFFFNNTPTTEIYTLSLHDALPIYLVIKAVTARAIERARDELAVRRPRVEPAGLRQKALAARPFERSEEHTSELQSRVDLVCRLLLEKKKKTKTHIL